MRYNRKVMNASISTYRGVEFKSKLEGKAYELFLDAGLAPEYELEAITLLDGFKPSVGFYTTPEKGRVLGLNSYVVRKTTYTPDFIIRGRRNYYIETKGFKTDSYNIKVKLFRRWLEDNDPTAYFFEVKTLNQVRQAINIIKDDKEEIT